VIGQRVEQGELLGYLVPTLSALEKAELEAEIAVLRGEVAEQELMIARSRELPLLPFREGRILSMRIELSKLRARRDALIAGLSARQPLVAPVSGVVARSEVRAGQVVEAREVIWEIADIDDLWVEADAFATNSRVAQTGSTAETQEGTSWRWRCRARACRPRPDSRRPFTSACWMLPRPSGLASR
jgi:multidrug resistance efflux pump